MLPVISPCWNPKARWTWKAKAPASFLQSIETAEERGGSRDGTEGGLGCGSWRARGRFWVWSGLEGPGHGKGQGRRSLGLCPLIIPVEWGFRIFSFSFWNDELWMLRFYVENIMKTFTSLEWDAEARIGKISLWGLDRANAGGKSWIWHLLRPLGHCAAHFFGF